LLRSKFKQLAEPSDFHSGGVAPIYNYNNNNNNNNNNSKSKSKSNSNSSVSDVVSTSSVRVSSAKASREKLLEACEAGDLNLLNKLLKPSKSPGL